MKIHALVARCDGLGARGDTAPFAPFAVRPTAEPLPVTRNFDPRLPPIGRAILSLEETDVWAEIELFADASPVGLFPALGGRAIEHLEIAGRRLITKWESVCVSLCDEPNTDDRIPRIDFANFFDRAEVKTVLALTMAGHLKSRDEEIALEAHSLARKILDVSPGGGIAPMSKDEQVAAVATAIEEAIRKFAG